jgi:nucleoside-diphosphate-sugar epimerase
MKMLIIGGTRNLGHFLVHELARAGHTVTVFNRGLTRDELPPHIERLRGDRTKPGDLERALDGRSFDAVVDTTLYKSAEAEKVIDLLCDRIGHYVFLSSGQVYLVREGAQRPFAEADYAGLLMPSPKPDTWNYEEWRYGMDKRACEDTLSAAWRDHAFPYTALRLPMVNSERDHFLRLYNYVLRLDDGGAILAPSTPNHALRHIYGQDVARAIVHIVTERLGIGGAYNLAQDETLTLEEFLGVLGAIMGVTPQIVRVRRDLLEANGFLPDCSPFSERWMSELDNARSKTELGIAYTPLETYLEQIVAYYRDRPPRTPNSYRRRKAELALLDEVDAR